MVRLTIVLASYASDATSRGVHPLTSGSIGNSGQSEAEDSRAHSYSYTTSATPRPMSFSSSSSGTETPRPETRVVSTMEDTFVPSTVPVTYSSLLSPPVTTRPLSQASREGTSAEVVHSTSMSSLGRVLSNSTEPVPLPDQDQNRSRSTSHKSSVISLTSDQGTQTLQPLASNSTPVRSRPVHPLAKTTVSPPQSKETSKLAKLAQARIHRTRPPTSPLQSETIATGEVLPTGVMSKRSSTVTTHITTTYQTLDSLTSYKPKSKLSMKVQGSQRSAAPTVAPEPEIQVEESAMFSAKPSAPRSLVGSATPSAFAALLLDNRIPTSSPPRPPQLPLGGRNASLASSAFTFDSPSPDDLVANARRGTALRQTNEVRR